MNGKIELSDEISLLTNIIVKTVQPERVYLFGSSVNGEFTPESDFDFYIIMNDKTERPLTITRKIRKAISKHKTHPVDLLVSSKTSFNEKALLPSLERSIANEGVLLYG